MMRLVKRPQPSRAWTFATPVLAVLLTMFVGGLLFAALGQDPLVTIRTIFLDPLFSEFAWYYRPQLLIKGAPLVLIAIGLSFGFRAGIWNIGAEGQYIVGAICGAAVGLGFYPGPFARPFRDQRNSCVTDAGLCGRTALGLHGPWCAPQSRRHGISG